MTGPGETYRVHLLGAPSGPGGGSVDVEVHFADGQRYGATFVTLANLAWQFDKNRRTGECAGGLYVWVADMVVVEDLTEDTVGQTVADLIAHDELGGAFAALDGPPGTVTGVDDVVSRLCATLPQAATLVEAHLADYGEVLVHVLVADVRRLLWQAHCDGDDDVVRAGLDVLDHALATGDAGVANAVAVSFVEGIGWQDPAVQPFIQRWPTALRGELDRQRSWPP